MKLNSILKLSSLGLVSLGLVSTVALTTTSCGDIDEIDVQVIDLDGEFSTNGTLQVEPSPKTSNFIKLRANDKATTVVTDAATMAEFDEVTLRGGLTVNVVGNAATSEKYSVTTTNAEAKSYILYGYYTDSDANDSTIIKYHPINIRLTVVAANES
jgi:hypothetical protein